MTIRIYTRQGCPLCRKGIANAQTVFGAESIELIDVDLDLGLLEKYTYRVPVIEDADGNVIAEGVVTESDLRAYVEAGA